eukprot:6212281-Pleurochrysis_carterae.AAC.1
MKLFKAVADKGRQQRRKTNTRRSTKAHMRSCAGMRSAAKESESERVRLRDGGWRGREGELRLEASTREGESERRKRQREKSSLKRLGVDLKRKVQCRDSPSASHQLWTYIQPATRQQIISHEPAPRQLCIIVHSKYDERIVTSVRV